MINPRYCEVKNLLRRSRTIDTYFLIKHSCAPYRACQHACMYCDGRAEKYYVEGDFERDIVVRTNFVERLEIELPKLKERGILFLSSGVTDPYQPIEEQCRLMSKASKLLAEYNHPVAVMTKSALAIRDLDNWRRVNEQSRFILMVSLTTLDDRIRQHFEPNASSVEDRVRMIQTFKEAGCVVGISAMPFLPHISDTEDNLIDFYTKMQELDVDFVLSSGLTLRPGVQKDCYMSVVKTHYPHLVEAYRNLYKEERASGNMVKSQASIIYGRMNSLSTQFSFPNMIPHQVYRDMMPAYDSVYVLLSHMIELFKVRGINVQRLKLAFKRYASWLDEEKRYLYRKRKATQLELERKLIYLAESDELMKLLGNRKLTSFLQDIILNHGILDYKTLKLSAKRRQSGVG